MSARFEAADHGELSRRRGETELRERLILGGFIPTIELCLGREADDHGPGMRPVAFFDARRFVDREQLTLVLREDVGEAPVRNSRIRRDRRC